MGCPVYMQLDEKCPAEISGGADDEDEMGAFNLLQQARRLRNLRSVLGDNLRLGLECGLILAT